MPQQPKPIELIIFILETNVLDLSLVEKKWMLKHIQWLINPIKLEFTKIGIMYSLVFLRERSK